MRLLYEGSHWRVSECGYPPGAVFPGRTKRCTWYVLQGACVLTTDSEHQLSVGDVVELDAGDYKVRVTGDDELRLIRVWELPQGMS